jgi:hypothetical protein
MTKPIVTTKATVHRSVTLVRGEQQEGEIVFLPKPAFFALNEEERQDVVADIKRLTAVRIHVRPHGEIGFCDYLQQYVTAEFDDQGRWEYDGGEVSTLETRYDRQLLDYKGPTRAPVPPSAAPAAPAGRGRKKSRR